MSARRDVELIIRARDDASRAFDTAAKALGDLVAMNGRAERSAEGTTSAFAEVANQFLKVDKVAAALAGKVDSSTQALARQARALAELDTRLRSNRVQLEGAAKAATALQEAIVETTRTGGNADPLRARLVATQQAMAELRREATTLERTLQAGRTAYSDGAVALGTLESEVRKLGTAQTFAKAEADSLTRSLEQQADAATRASQVRATVARSTDSTTGKSATQSADVFRSAGLTQFERSAKAEAASIAQLRAEIDPLGTVMRRLATETERVNDLQRLGKITATEQAAALRLLNANADRAARQLGQPGTASLFGLAPYELQNLSFQVNDVFTQLASGTDILQTLGQQAGQIIQIFPRVGSAIAGAFRSAPILGAAAAIGTLIVALANAASEADRLKTFGGLLASSADGARLQAQGLADAANALDTYGLSAEDAVKVVRSFVREGLDPALFEQFGESAKTLADVLGIDVADAARQVADAFSGGFEAVKKLDDATGFLTDSERENIKALFESGRAADARTEALRVFSDRMNDAADKMRGPWAEAARELDKAWSGFLDTLSDTTPVEKVYGALQQLASGTASFIRGLRNADDIADLTIRIAEGQKRLNLLGQYQSEFGFNKDRVRQIDTERANLAALRERVRVLTEADAAERKNSDTVAAGAQRAAKSTRDLAKANAELRGETEGATAAQRLASAESKARREAERDLAADAFKFADEAAKQEHLRLKVTQARAAEEKKITAEGKAQARETERARKEAEKAAKFTQFRDPVAGPVTSGFGPRKSPGGVGSTFHRGIDFAAAIGTPVNAPALGVVEVVGFNKELGKYVVINHGRGVKSTFGHLSDNGVVATGDAVRAGDTIGRSGNTGSATTGPHLHFQVTVNGKAVDPRSNGGKFQIDAGDAAEKVADTQETNDEFRLKQQDEFNRRLEDENERRQQNIASAQAELGLDGESLLAAQRAEAIADAILAKQQELDRINADLDRKGLARVEFTDQQREAVERLTAAEFDLAHARQTAEAKRAAASRPVDDLSAERDAVRQQIDLLRSQGQGGGADVLEPKLAAINEQLRAAIDNLIAFYSGLTAADLALEGLTPDSLAAIVTQLQNAKLEAVDVGRVLGVSLNDIAQQATSNAVSSLDRFAQSIAEGGNAIEALGNTFAEFALNFLRQIAQMIQQQIVFNLISGLLKSISGGIGGGTGGGGGGIGLGGQFHDGGVVGSGGESRAVSPVWFQNAMRYHGGGIAGLKPNEIPAILERGEEVLTANDARHVANGGGQSPINLKVVNAIDGDDLVEKALAGRIGERAILNFIRSNAGAVKAALG